MPGKRPRADSHSDDINLVFEMMFASIDAADSVTWNGLKELKHQLLSAEAGRKDPTHKAAELGIHTRRSSYGLWPDVHPHSAGSHKAPVEN